MDSKVGFAAGMAAATGLVGFADGLGVEVVGYFIGGSEVGLD